MTAISILTKQVVAQIPLANDLMIERVLVETAREFCEYTRAWRANVIEDVTADTLGVVMTPPTSGELIDILTVTLDGTPLVRKTHAQLDALEPKWRVEAATSNYYTLGDLVNEVLVAPLSDTSYADGLAVRAAWKPVLGAAVLDDLLVSKYSDAFVEGALGKLFGIPAQPWSSGGLASHYQGLFTGKMELAKQSATDSHMKGVVRKIKYGGL